VYKWIGYLLPISLSFWVELVSASTLTWYKSQRSRVQILTELYLCLHVFIFTFVPFSLTVFAPLSGYTWVWVLKCISGLATFLINLSFWVELVSASTLTHKVSCNSWKGMYMQHMRVSHKNSKSSCLSPPYITYSSPPLVWSTNPKI
jgi:hypothetical protein